MTHWTPDMMPREWRDAWDRPDLEVRVSEFQPSAFLPAPRVPWWRRLMRWVDREVVR